MSDVACDITGLLLLAAFSWPSGDLNKQSVVFMEPWVATSEPVKPRDAG